MSKLYPSLQPHLIESICKVIADTEDGLTGTEIGKILSDCNMQDTHSGITKWKRLYNAFVTSQNSKACSNEILKFIQQALQPVRYIGKQGVFEDRRNEINKRLSFIGLEISESAKYRYVDKTSTITEAEQRANRFKHKLEIRNISDHVYKYCSAELLVENYFHSVFEATKSVADRIRDLTGLTTDGATLIETAFALDNPLIKINKLQDANDRSEHLGFANLIKGLFGIIRNPTAHLPKIKFEIQEDDALDVMSIISFIHKRLDKASKT